MTTHITPSRSLLALTLTLLAVLAFACGEKTPTPDPATTTPASAAAPAADKPAPKAAEGIDLEAVKKEAREEATRTITDDNVEQAAAELERELEADQE